MLTLRSRTRSHDVDQISSNHSKGFPSIRFRVDVVLDMERMQHPMEKTMQNEVATGLLKGP